jgi:phosphatidylserine decarboxylase
LSLESILDFSVSHVYHDTAVFQQLVEPKDMKVPLTEYGLPQVVFLPAVIIALMVTTGLFTVEVLPVLIVITVEVILFVALAWVLAFFRDPPRSILQQKDVLLAPADGKIADIETIDEGYVFKHPALRICIFLNIFNVHINRIPCAVKVDKITYKKGKYKNAINSKASRVNESNDVLMTRLNKPYDTLLVRQISGAIARRIVCRAKTGQNFTGGQKFGMIKFGSRTELYVPIRENVKCLIKVGDKVKAGFTPLVRYE